MLPVQRPMAMDACLERLSQACVPFNCNYMYSPGPDQLHVQVADVYTYTLAS